MESRSRRKFHAQIPGPEAAPNRSPHLTARGSESACRKAENPYLQVRREDAKDAKNSFAIFAALLRVLCG